MNSRIDHHRTQNYLLFWNHTLLWLITAPLLLMVMLLGPAHSAEWGFKIRDTIEDTGAEVVKVYPGTLADGKIQVGDIIVEVAGWGTDRASDVYKRMGAGPSPGQKVKLYVMRRGSKTKVKIWVPGEAATNNADTTHWQGGDTDRSLTSDIFGMSGPTAASATSEPAHTASSNAEENHQPYNEPASSTGGYADTREERFEPSHEPMLPPPSQPGAPTPQAMIMIGDMQTKAANASSAIGDGLREMLITELHNSGLFIVVERIGLQSLAAEQALSRSRMAGSGMALPEGKMDIAEVMVMGAVTEFEPEAGGTGINLGIARLPFSFGRKTSNAHMAMDIRVVDVTTGRVLGAKRIKGEASSSSTTVGIAPKVGGGRIPVSLGSFQNTPMEAAIRESIAQSIDFISRSVPRKYYRVQ